MPAFIRTTQGKIAAIDHVKKELSLVNAQVVSANVQDPKMDFSLERNVRVANMANKPMKLEVLKEGQKVEVGYTQNKSKRTAVYIFSLD